MTATAIMNALRANAFTFGDEAELQAGIATALRTSGVTFEREVILGAGDRIDFVVDTIGIEVKLKASPNAVIRQLHRYAQIETLTSLMLVTSSLKLASAVPHELNGKPVIVFCLAGDAL